jgi:tetratricopeptide (TPR) repeat protein
MEDLIHALVRGASVREAAALATKMLGRPVTIPRGFAKKTGEQLENEHASFKYIFLHRYLPGISFVFFLGMIALSIFYLCYRFIYMPAHAKSLYENGLERIAEGDYQRGNERVEEAWAIDPEKKWFYAYAEAFARERQYLYAEEKYEQLLILFPQDKKGGLDYAEMETNALQNFRKAEEILRRHVLWDNLDDKDGLLALGDNFLAWGEYEPDKLEDARRAFATVMELYGRTPDLLERMLIYFIRTDQLSEVLPLQMYFRDDVEKPNPISPEALTEMAGYLLHKRLAPINGVPDPALDSIDGLRALLLRAALVNPDAPEPYYYLSQYYERYGDSTDVRETLSASIKAFDKATVETPRRTGYRIDAEARYADKLIETKEYFAAEEELAKGVEVYEDSLARGVIKQSPAGGRLYGRLGDLEYFVKADDLDAAMGYYEKAEANEYSPSDQRYRMGYIEYKNKDYGSALDFFYGVSREYPNNRKLLFALGNTAQMRGSYNLAESNYRRLISLLDNDRMRFGTVNDENRPNYDALASRLINARNNLGVTMEALSMQTGNQAFYSEAQGLYAESSQAADVLTRDPTSEVRSGQMNLGYLNTRDTLYPESGYVPQLYMQIDRDLPDRSIWTE